MQTQLTSMALYGLHTYLAKSFNYSVRYIHDDLLTFNDATFETEITNVYVSELTLKRTTESTTLFLLRYDSIYQS